MFLGRKQGELQDMIKWRNSVTVTWNEEKTARDEVRDYRERQGFLESEGFIK